VPKRVAIGSGEVAVVMVGMAGKRVPVGSITPEFGSE
jgi:hypothetical protein